MRLTIIGSGNVATVLAKLFFQKGFIINEVYSRNYENASQLATLVNAKAIQNINELSKQTDIVLLAVSDKAIEEICATISFPNALVLNTAGSLSKNILQTVSNRFGVLYPVQSMRKEMPDLTPVPFLIDGSTEEVTNAIEKLALSISDVVVKGGDELRLKLHVAAVFVCNFPNFLYLQSAKFCEKENIPFSLLQDLMEETANRIRYKHPSEVFTGPAVRGDMQTVEKHISALAQLPDLQKLYQLLTDNILLWKKENQ